MDSPAPNRSTANADAAYCNDIGMKGTSQRSIPSQNLVQRYRPPLACPDVQICLETTEDEEELNVQYNHQRMVKNVDLGKGRIPHILSQP